jgi:wyosine [tRNA(Phe)-imidazoG37] synthetase (radical SAM superfamily)
MKYLFGPVNSRRLGRSLGIDLVPYKTCTLSCIYCECGETTVITSDIKEYIPTDRVIEELDSYLSTKPLLDVVTFSGSGEPTLHSGIGRIISFLSDKFPEYEIAILTNGTLLWREDVRKSILRADIIIPSLDAVSEDLFTKIARPVAGINAALVVEGLTELRNEFDGRIFLEIFIIPGLNNSDRELEMIKQACYKIKPDKIQLNTLDRPGTEDWVVPASSEQLEYVKSFLEPFVVEIIGEPSFERRGENISDDVVDAVIATIKRRPSTIEDLSLTLGIRVVQLNKIIKRLRDSGVIEVKKMGRGNFYSLRKDYER